MNKVDRTHDWLYKRWRPGRHAKKPPRHYTIENLRKKAEKIKAAKQMVYGDGVAWRDAYKKLGLKSLDTLRTLLYQDIARLDLADQADGFDPMMEEDMKKDLDPVSFIEGEDYLGLKMFPMQRLIIKAFYGMDLTEWEQDEIDRLVKEGKCTWKGQKQYRELVLVIGMKGGKTTLAGGISCYEEYLLWSTGDPVAKYGFPPGEEIYIINVATDSEQAEDTIFAKTRARINNSRYYRSRRLREGFVELSTEYRFPNGVHLQSGHSNSDSQVGRTCKLVLFDELARFKDKKTGKFSAHRVYFSITRNVTPFKTEGKIVSISSPLHSKDMIMGLFKTSVKVDDMLGFHLATWECNPHLSLDSPLMQSEVKKNPEEFHRDYGARPPESREAYYRIPEKIDLIGQPWRHNPIDDKGRLQEWFKPKEVCQYFMHGDPAARNDAYGIGLAHVEGADAIIDLALEIKPQDREIDIQAVETLFLLLVDRFNVRDASFDTWQAAGLIQALGRRGVTVANLLVDKKVHDVLKEKIYAERVKTYKNTSLNSQLKGLLLLNGKKVDHEEDGEKDLADAAAGAVYNAVMKTRGGLAFGGSEDGDDSPRSRENDEGVEGEDTENVGAGVGGRSLGGNYGGRRSIWD